MKIVVNEAGNKYSKDLLYTKIILLASGILWSFNPSVCAANCRTAAGTDVSQHSAELNEATRYVRTFNFESLRLATMDLTDTFGKKYPKGKEYLERLEGLKKLSKDALSSFNKDDDPVRQFAAQTDGLKLADELKKLRLYALLSNPLLDFNKLLVLKRKHGQLGLPVNHKCNSGIKRTGYDNELAVLSPWHGHLGRDFTGWKPVPRQGRLRTLFRPPAGEYVGEIDLHFDGNRLLFTMPKGRSWQIFEIGVDGRDLRQVSRSRHPDVDNFDACYLPDGRIVFASTASFHAVPCWHGKERACSIYMMNADGTGVRQLCFDQDIDLHPAVLPTGQVIYSRWDYAGTMHIYLRPLMVMNPDGTGQRAVYGSNSYWPNALYFPRGIPGAHGKIVAIVAGYHGVPRMGELALLDITKGSYETDGVVQRIPGRGKPVKPVIRDNLVDNSWPKFLHPYPLSDKYFLVSSRLSPKSSWGIYLVDVFDNILPIYVRPNVDLFEPIPLRRTMRPLVVPDRVDLNRDNAVVYLHDIYAGPGLAGVPRGTIKRLRIVAYHFGYPGLAGPDKIGCGGPWEVMRIIGTVPVHEDGSAMFRVPANTPLCVQPLDKQGKAVQLMRSWFTAMPGENVSCVGCHEKQDEIPSTYPKLAATRQPVQIEPWYGPPRGLDFERDVQPVLDRYCVACHNSQPRPDGRRVADLRSQRHVKGYRGRELTRLAASRLHPVVRKALGGTAVRYTPAYEALLPYIRRVNIEDDVGLLVPGEYHADTSELIQMLTKGHYNVRLDGEAWDRLITWIDLNGPCHGTWGEVAPIPEDADRRRRQLCRLYGGPKDDPEQIPPIPRSHIVPIVPEPSPETQIEIPKVAGWPFDAEEARRRQAAAAVFEKTIELDGGVAMKLVRIPAGRFVMGAINGEVDERPPARVVIGKPFWMGAFEVTNEQYHRFDPDHDSGRFTKRFQGPDGPGLSLGRPKQPVVRVSCEQALGFCRWLSQKTGAKFTLPTEAQWEYASRAGSLMPLSYGGLEADFSTWANVADKALSVRPGPTGGLESNITAHHDKGILLSAVYGGNILCDERCDDGAIATENVGSYRPNAWGLYDMHGNVAEWTRTTYKPYPYNADDGRDRADEPGRKVVRGGSWCDRLKRCRSAFRLSYPRWQRVHNVGFRVICEKDPPAPISEFQALISYKDCFVYQTLKSEPRGQSRNRCGAKRSQNGNTD